MLSCVTVMPLRFATGQAFNQLEVVCLMTDILRSWWLSIVGLSEWGLERVERKQNKLTSSLHLNFPEITFFKI